jgi:hypothetical protein
MKTKLSYHEYLMGLALFTMAQKHYAKSREFEQALCELLEVEESEGIYAGCVSDAIVNDGSFDHGLKGEGVEVEPKAGDLQ